MCHDISKLENGSWYVKVSLFYIYLNARRAELVDSGAADPNISRRERLSSEPILCLDHDVLTLIIRAILTWTSHSRSGNRRPRLDVGDLGTGSFPLCERNPEENNRLYYHHNSYSTINIHVNSYYHHNVYVFMNLCNNVFLEKRVDFSLGRRLGSSWRWPSMKEAPRSTPPLLDWG